jgi:hypothetical protein
LLRHSLASGRGHCVNCRPKRILTCYLALAVLLAGGRLVTASETQAAWPRITLAEAKQVQLVGPLAETFERGVARLAREPYTLDWLLADVSFKVGRIFTNYRRLGRSALQCNRVAGEDCTRLLARPIYAGRTSDFGYGETMVCSILFT